MADILITGGGGGSVASEDTTAKGPQVLEDYTYLGADTDDDIGTGTMKNRNTVGKNDAIGISDNYSQVAMTEGSAPQINIAKDGKSYFSICPKSGYYNGNSYVGALTSKVASVGGLTGNKMISGQSAFGVSGTIPNLTSRSTIEHATGNGTKVILGDEAFISTNTDGVNRFEIRYNGDSGYITGNTLFAVPTSKAASVGGLTANKLIKNQTAFGITGTGAGYINANYSLWNGNIPATYVASGSYGEAILLENYDLENSSINSANIIVLETTLSGVNNGAITVIMTKSTNTSYLLEQDGSASTSKGIALMIPNTDYYFVPYYSISSRTSALRISKLALRIYKSSGSGTLPQTSGLNIKITHCFSV